MLYQETNSWVRFVGHSFYGLMVPIYDPIAAWAVHRSKVSPNTPLLTKLSKNFWTETYTVIYQHLFYYLPLQEHLNNSISFAVSVLILHHIATLPGPQSIMDRYGSWR